MQVEEHEDFLWVQEVPSEKILAKQILPLLLLKLLPSSFLLMLLLLLLLWMSKDPDLSWLNSPKRLNG
ncbi:hypothetical protein OIU78_005768 [Salix suchowensis]|nr:hypothetical protein OIU78_005768 [Salix suchowensis]